MDALLEPYLRAVEAQTEQDSLSELLASHAEPVIRRTVAGRLSGLWDDIDDVCSEARLELLLHLRRMKSEAGPAIIEDFGAYVATVAGNACNHYFRRRRPGRARLRKQIRFLLTNQPTLRIYAGPGGRDCASVATLSKLPLLSDPRRLEELPSLIEGDRDLAVLLGRILETAGAAIDLDDLANIVARIWHIPPDPVHTSDATELDAIPSTSLDPELSIDHRRYTERLWTEIRQLPRPQRVALLLNLRDGRGNSVLSLFPLAGLASFPEIAGLLEVAEGKLASLWTGLPCDDNTIANLLDCTRQQVINLRMSGRKRLANRMRQS